ncbi:MAG: hypothetical protein ACYDAZ_06320 [Thermoplasmataceae archaeon]
MMDLTFRNFKLSFESIKRITVKEADLSLSDLQELGETAIFLKQLTDSVKMTEYDKENLKGWLEQLKDRIGLRLDNLAYRFWYTAKKFGEDPIQQIDNGIKVAVSLSALKILGVNFYENYHTAYKYLIRDIPTLLKMLYEILDAEDAHLWFLTFNLLDLLHNLGDENSGIFTSHFRELRSFITDNDVYIQEVCKTNPGLRTYASEIFKKYKFPMDIDMSGTSVSGKGAVFSSLSSLNNKIIPRESVLSSLNSTKFQHFYWMISAWSTSLKGSKELFTLPYTGKIDYDVVYNVTWGKLSTPKLSSFTREDVEKILNFGDAEIRNHLFYYFIKHPNVTPESKSRLGFERDKANAGGEIADFNVEIEVGDSKMVVAIPIKSGRELGTKGLDSIRESYTHQLIRPLVRLPGKSVTHAIMVTKPTLNLVELVTELRNNLDLPISIIDTMTYGAFLKREGFI